MNMQQQKSPNVDFSQRLSSLVNSMFGGKQNALALRAGITPQAIHTYINPPDGKPRFPKSNELYRLAVACGMSMEELLTGQKNTDSAPTEVARWRDRALAAEQKLSVVKAGLSGMLKKI